MIGQFGAGERDDEAVGGGNDGRERFRASDVEAGVIVDLLARGDVAPVDVSGLVTDLRGRDEPALADGIFPGPARQPGRPGRPDADAGSG